MRKLFLIITTIIFTFTFNSVFAAEIEVKMLNKDAQKGVYLAYKYYLSLFRKIQKMDAKEVLEKRIRISNIKKIMIGISSQIQLKIK